jgi:hypothetical protein
MTAADTGQFSMRVTPIAKTFAAEIEDIDLRSPLDAARRRQHRYCRDARRPL